MSWEEIEEHALRLPTEERERLAERLLTSVEESPLSEVDKAWLEEAERRYQDYKAGRVQGIPAEQAFADIRRNLGWLG